MRMADEIPSAGQEPRAAKVAVKAINVCGSKDDQQKAPLESRRK